MKSHPNKLFSLLILLWLSAALIYPEAHATASVHTVNTVDKAHLEQARELINSKHYHSGYMKFKSMAQHGCPFSQCIVGLMHQKGIGVKQNSAKALYWFQKSAQQGFADAEHRLGLMYYHGDGITKDLDQAKQWFSMAASHGVEEARQLLSQIPGESNLSNNLSQAKSQASWTADNIHQSWQGYTDLTKQIEQLSSAAFPD